MNIPIDDDVLVRWVQGEELAPEEAKLMDQALATDAELRREAALSRLAHHALSWNPDLIDGEEPLDEETIFLIDRDFGYTTPEHVSPRFAPGYITDLRARGADFLHRAQSQLDRLADQLDRAARGATSGSLSSSLAVASAASGDTPATLKAEYLTAENANTPSSEALLSGVCKVDDQGRIVLNVRVLEPLRPHWRESHLDLFLDVTGVTGADEEFNGEASALLMGRVPVAPNGSVRATLVPEGIQLRSVHSERLRFRVVGPGL